MVAAADIGMHPRTPNLLNVLTVTKFSFIPNHRLKGPAFIIYGHRMEDMLYRFGRLVIIKFVAPD